MEYKKYKDFIIIREPQKYSLNDYEKTIAKMINTFKNLPSLISIYQLGSISLPGISDLDLVLVFEDDVQGLDYKGFYKQLNNKDHYILMHAPFVITKNLFESMRFFYIPGEFKLLIGHHIPIKPIGSSKVIQPLQLTIVTEYILGLYFVVLRALNTKIIKIRSLLCGMGALKYDLEVLNLNENNFPEGLRMIDRIMQLRRDWFEIDEENRLTEFINLLGEFPGFLCKILGFVEEKIRILVSPFGDSRISLIRYGINSFVLKSKNKKTDLYVKESLFASLLKRFPYSSLTDDIIWIFSNYFARIPPELVLLLTESVDTSLEPFFEKRRKLIEDYLNFHKRTAGFGILLPPLRIPISVLTLKWRGLISLKRLIFSRYENNSYFLGA